MRTIRNCNVCVVGGAGFLGTHLVDHLVDQRNCNVVVMDNLVVGQRDWVHPKATFIHHDITGSEEFMVNVFRRYGIEYVFNYAAYPYIPTSFERPLQVFTVNATGAIQVINAAQSAGCKGILQVSSAEIYGSSTSGMLTEKSEVAPHSTYGAAKAAVDYYCQSAWKERQTPVIALRQFNCLSGFETHPYVVPEIISQLSVGPTVKLGNNSFRDFQDAGDAVRMATELLEKGQFGDVYNMGSEDGIKIYDLAELIGQLMDHEKITIEVDQARVRPWEIWHLQSDNTKLYSVIEARAHTPLEQTLEDMIDYFWDNGGKWVWEGRS